MNLRRISFFLFPVFAVGVLFAEVALAADAAIVWESERIEKALPIGDERITAEFVFTNNSGAAVSIDSITTTCGCTAASFTRGEIAAGERGSVRMEFNAGQRRGLQRNAATVNFHGASIPPQRIEFVVSIPEVIAARPVLLRWPEGSLHQSRTVTLTLNAEVSTRLRAINFPKDHFSLTLVGHPSHFSEDADWDSLTLIELDDADEPVRLEIRPLQERPPENERYTIDLHAITEFGSNHQQRLHLRMR